MMIKALLSTVSFSLIVYSGYVKAEETNDNYAQVCAEMGYKTDLPDCTVGLPLICPYSGNTDARTIKCLCIDKSCRGYSLLESDLDELASDGRKIREHIEALESCEAGINEDKVTYYRIKSCKTGSLYQVQNDKPTCDIGCPQDRYPYSEHPGDLAGVVESCVDEKGTWFGYLKCNEGWVPSGVGGHECKFSDCNVKNYPYSYDPNTIQQRGTTTYCKVGGNNYYQYSSCDEGFTPKGSVCQAKCQLQDCEIKSNAQGYNEWACGVEDKLNCQVGDAAYLDNSYLGVIAYQPEGNGETLIIATEKNEGITPFGTKKYSNEYGESQAHTVDSTNGKKSTFSYIKKIKADSHFSYPVIEACYAYSSPMCDHDICRTSEWFLASEAELKNTYKYRYILYNATAKNAFTGSKVWELYADEGRSYAYVFQYSNGTHTSSGKSNMEIFFPVLSYTQK